MQHVLVIDDDPVTLSFVSDCLIEEGFQVSTSECAVYSNDIVYNKQNPPDLILMDVMMPLMSGTRKARLLKDRDQSRHIPILLISSKSEAELQLLMAESQADGFIRKPFTCETLISKLREHI